MRGTHPLDENSFEKRFVSIYADCCRFSSKSSSIAEFGKLADAAMKMEGVLKLYFGESNVPTPEIHQACCHQSDGGRVYLLHGKNAGLPGLRQDLAEYYRRLQGVELDPRVGGCYYGLRRPGASTWDTVRY